MQKQMQPVIYLLGYYYSYSFLYECPFGKNFLKCLFFQYTPYINI